MIDILNLAPSTISRDLKGKYLLIYGEPKIGKTTLLSQLPKSLIMAFEPGTNAIDGAYIIPIRQWSDAKTVLKQLKTEQAKNKYDFIGIDTADIAWELCEKYICTQNDVDTLGEIAWGKGFSMCAREFSDFFREIALLGYGICFVSHESEKHFKDEKGEEYIKIAPALDKRPYGIVNKMVDIISYIRAVPDDNGVEKRYMFLRGNNKFLAGSRFKYIEPRIEFTYDDLVNAIYNAIDIQKEKDGAVITDETNRFYDEKEIRSFDEVRKEAEELWVKILENDKENINKLNDIIDRKSTRLNSSH